MGSETIQGVAVISTGVIGASWATCFLAAGLDVTATDPAPQAEATLRATVAAQWPAMAALGLAPGASPKRLRFVASAEAAVAGAQFVQENAPEALALKRDLFRRLDAAAAPDAILASSSSSLVPSEFQDACGHPERVVLGHPFNPPHLIPLVEVAGGEATSAAAVERTLVFYRSVGKHPIRLRREIRGHIANRLQAAVWQEAAHLVANGVASVAEIDAAIAYGPGLRWALLGPFLNLHLAGGPGGIRALFGKPLWQATEAMMRDLGRVSVGNELAERIAEGIGDELAGRDEAEIVQRRDEALLALLRLKAAAQLA